MHTVAEHRKSGKIRGKSFGAKEKKASERTRKFGAAAVAVAALVYHIINGRRTAKAVIATAQSEPAPSGRCVRRGARAEGEKWIFG